MLIKPVAWQPGLATRLLTLMATLRSSYGGPAVSETTRQIEAIEDFVKAHTK